MMLFFDALLDIYPCFVSVNPTVLREHELWGHFFMNSLTTIWWPEFSTCYYFDIVSGQWRMISIFCGITLNQPKYTGA